MFCTLRRVTGCAVEPARIPQRDFGQGGPWYMGWGQQALSRGVPEVPCSLEDNLRLTIAYRTAQDIEDIEYEVTVDRWEITSDGDVQKSLNEGH